MGTLRILIAEDDPICRGMMAELLRLWTHDARSCCSGEEAITWLGKEPFDILITDFRMPGMDGLALIDKARDIRPGLATVLMTGVPQEDLSERLHQSGVTAFFPKPPDLQELSLFLGRVKAGEKAGTEAHWGRACCPLPQTNPCNVKPHAGERSSAR